MYGQIQKIPVTTVAQPCVNLLVKPRIFSGFQEKYINVCILKGEMPLKMHRIFIFFRKKIIKKNMCLPNLKFSDPFTKTHLFFSFGLTHMFQEVDFPKRYCERLFGKDVTVEEAMAAMDENGDGEVRGSRLWSSIC